MISLHWCRLIKKPQHLSQPMMFSAPAFEPSACVVLRILALGNLWVRVFGMCKLIKGLVFGACFLRLRTICWGWETPNAVVASGCVVKRLDGERVIYVWSLQAFLRSLYVGCLSMFRLLLFVFLFCCLKWDILCHVWKIELMLWFSSWHYIFCLYGVVRGLHKFVMTLQCILAQLYYVKKDFPFYCFWRWSSCCVYFVVCFFVSGHFGDVASFIFLKNVRFYILKKTIAAYVCLLCLLAVKEPLPMGSTMSSHRLSIPSQHQVWVPS